jgi:hypothetical protein
MLSWLKRLWRRRSRPSVARSQDVEANNDDLTTWSSGALRGMGKYAERADVRESAWQELDRRHRAMFEVIEGGKSRRSG